MDEPSASTLTPGHVGAWSLSLYWGWAAQSYFHTLGLGCLWIWRGALSAGHSAEACPPQLPQACLKGSRSFLTWGRRVPKNFVVRKNLDFFGSCSERRREKDLGRLCHRFGGKFHMRGERLNIQTDHGQTTYDNRMSTQNGQGMINDHQLPYFLY